MSQANKASIKVLKTEENFTGFDVHDILLSSIKIKQNRIINILSSEKVFLPGFTHKRSVKRGNKDQDQSEAMKSIDIVKVQSTLDYDSKDWQAIKDDAKSNNLPSEDDDVETNISSNEIRNTELNGAFREYSDSSAILQSFNFMVTAMRHVFKYLKTHELLSASRVCTAWHIIAMNRSLWQTVRLKNSMVCNWNKCIGAIRDQGSESLDMRRMLIPTKIEDFDKFWMDFTISLKKAQELKCIELYRCSVSVVEDTIYSLPQLRVLNAMSIKNPNISKEEKNPNKLMFLNLRNLDQMTNLTEIRIKGLTGIKLTHMPSFANLVNLKILSLTSIKAFPKDFCRSLETLSTSLEFFEIGDCDCLPNDFSGVLIRLKNLTSLRLENCFGSFKKVVKEVLSSIRGLDNLKILELINLEFSYNVEDELEKLTNIKALLIIPMYISRAGFTNRHLIDCVRKLAGTLTHLVWGLTFELIRVTELYIIKYHPIFGYNTESIDVENCNNSIPILRTRKSRQPYGEETVTYEMEGEDIVDIISVPDFGTTLETLMTNGKSKVVKIPFVRTTRVYLLKHFNDL